ncbi:rCG25356, isoform CRA_a [Rattus norvegicus]|uniref:RCG25356, isoform CRA_a n=1 Tax=Rattus norvegicus TaxID=10116 RepID=A6I2H0_RAT|nr:rCG25356, isoform CRA_a [Rattus norvegicus]
MSPVSRLLSPVFNRITGRS